MTTTTQPVHSENILPRDRFQLSGTRLSDHRDLITKESFRIAIDTALLQYQTELAANCKDQYSAMSNGLRTLGALEFVSVLRKLADKPVPVNITPISDNLKS